MRLIVTLLVRDEADVVAATIEHHLDQGAQQIVVTDNGSVDGTVGILQRYQDAGAVELHHQPQQDYRQAQWVTAMAQRAAELGADWVVNADADEFWVPKDPGLRLVEALAAIPGSYGAVVARRVNLVGPAAGAPGRQDPVGWLDRLRYRDRLTLSERGTPLGPKVCHRADPTVQVAQGNHTATGPAIGPNYWDQPLEILHVPLRSWDQFERRTRNGGSSYAANSELDPEVGWHWRADYRRLREGTLYDTYLERSVPAPSAADQDRYTESTWLAGHLRGLLDRAVLPAELAAITD